MKKLIINLALLLLPLSGCANGNHAKSVAVNIVVASDVAADTLADAWSDGASVRIDECRALQLETPEERADCMGLFHPDEVDKVVAGLTLLVAVQMAVKEAAECEALSTCLQEVDWEALAEQAGAAWNALLPYVNAVKKEAQP